MNRAALLLSILVARAAQGAEPEPVKPAEPESNREHILLPLTLAGATDGKGVFGGGFAFAAGPRTDMALAIPRRVTHAGRMQAAQGDHVLDDDLQRFDFERCHAWLTGTYWSPGITRAEVERGFSFSTLVVGAYCGARQDGCLRLVSDLTRFAYVMDVFVDPEQRGRGLGRALVRFAIDHPSLELVQRWVLGTNDAHEVYRQLGFSELPHPEQWMTLRRERAWF